MIDVPYNVKKALRKGRYKKNYKFKIYTVTTEPQYITRTTLLNNYNFVIDKTGTYRFYNESENIGFSIILQGQSWSRSWLFPAQAGATNTDVTIDLEPYSDATYSVIYDDEYQDAPLLLQLKTEDKVTKEYAFTIDNDTLIKESVKFDERMVTGKYLEFGLCEGSSLEFQYFNHPSITNCEIEAILSVEYINDSNERAWYDMPMGWFTVDQCPMQFNTGIHKVTAYNKLRSDYLDEKANLKVMEGLSDPNGTLSMYDIRRILLSDYEVFIEKTEGYRPKPSGQQVPFYEIDLGEIFSFTEFYGIENPFNARMYELGYGSMPTSSSKFNMMFTGNIYRYYGDGFYPLYSPLGDAEAEYKKGTFEGLERNFYLYLVELIDSAEIKLNGNVITGEGFIDYLCANNKMTTIFSIQVNYGNPMDPTTFRTETYSTIQWDYEERNNITHTVKGTMRDFDSRIWLDTNSIFIRQPVDIYSHIFYNHPSGIMRTLEFAPYIEVETDDSNVYEYYTDSTYTTTDRKRYAGLIAPNGERYTDDDDDILVYGLEDVLTEADKVTIQPSAVSDFTLREITSAVFELECQYGKLDRETDLFTGIELNHGGLYPADNLYPADDLYPQGNAAHPYPSEYLKLWTDTVGVQSFRYLIITYKTTEDDGQGNISEVDKVLQRTVNTHGTKDYNMSSNWLFRNLIWTEEEIAEYADAMVEKMRNITWFPFEMWSVGLPYLEAGDAIEITDRQGNTYTSYILNRQLNGIHNLQDTFINGELDIF